MTRNQPAQLWVQSFCKPCMRGRFIACRMGNRHAMRRGHSQRPCWTRNDQPVPEHRLDTKLKCASSRGSQTDPQQRNPLPTKPDRVHVWGRGAVSSDRWVDRTRSPLVQIVDLSEGTSARSGGFRLRGEQITAIFALNASETGPGKVISEQRDAIGRQLIK